MSITTIEREADWRDLITRIRKRYSGPIVYASNWWGEYDRIAFWDAVDYMGINAFFPLSDRADPSLAELRSRATSNPPSTWVSSRGVTGSSSRPTGTGPGSTA